MLIFCILIAKFEAEKCGALAYDPEPAFANPKKYASRRE